MAEITAALVKELREKTGAGMMDSKKALVENDGDLEASVDWLRKKGLSKAAKKSGRVAAEGLVGVAVKGGDGVVVEVNSETDFVARNDKFQDFVRQVAGLGLGVKDVDALKSAAMSGGTVDSTLTELIATIGENMALRRMARLTAKPGVVAAYIHNAAGDSLGKIGVLVALKSEGDAAKLVDLGRKIAMHVAATNPLALNVDELDPAVVAKEREVFADQARQSGKPENIVEKMVEGRLRKFYEESVLTQQVFVVDGENPVGKVVENAAKDVGAQVEIVGFVRMALGEGVEKKSEDFAAEVAAASGRKDTEKTS